MWLLVQEIILTSCHWCLSFYSKSKEMPTRWDRLYEEGKRHQKYVEKLREERCHQQSIEEAEACTFRPVVSKNGTHETIVNTAAVFSRLAKPTQATMSHHGPTFCPAVNHNLDSQLEAWAHGVPVHERLYGESICRMERERLAFEGNGDGASHHVDPNYIDTLFEKTQRELNGESDDSAEVQRSPSADVVYSARYLEDPAERELRLAALRQRYSERCTFKPVISHTIKRPAFPVSRTKRSARPPSPSEAFLQRLGKDVAREGLLGQKPSVDRPTLCQSTEYSQNVQTAEKRKQRAELAAALQLSRRSWNRAKGSPSDK
jgi:hypothetical protein